MKEEAKPVTWGRCLEAGTEAEATKEFCFWTYFQTHVLITFYTAEGHWPRGSTLTHSGLSPPISINNQENDGNKSLTKFAFLQVYQVYNQTLLSQHSFNRQIK